MRCSEGNSDEGLDCIEVVTEDCDKDGQAE